LIRSTPSSLAVCSSTTATAASPVLACLAILTARATITITMTAAIATTAIPITRPTVHWVVVAISADT
jgi:hypothetical protein